MENSIKGNELPDSWCIERLGDFVISEKGKKPKNFSKAKTKEHYLPYVNIAAFEKNRIEEYTDGVGCVLCEENDFLMVWDGSRSGYIGKAIKGALGSTLVKINFPGIENDYAYYFLLSKYLQINTRAKGTGTPHVDPGLLWNYKFPIPPLSEQKRIVSKIEELFTELDKGVEQLESTWQQLKVYKQAVLKYAYEGKLTNANLKSELPGKWKWMKLSDICNIIGGVTKGRDFKGKDTIQIPYLRVANVQDGYLNLEEIKTIEALPSDKDKYKLIYGDVLYTEGGDKDKLGRGTIWKDEIVDCIHQNHIFRARPLSGEYDSKYIAYYSQTKLAKDYFFKNGKQTTNLASINQTILSKLPIPICPILEQKKIVLEIEGRMSVCEKILEIIEMTLKQAEILRYSILKLAFNGKLVKQNTNDEPAQKLLERIRAEKKKNEPKQKSKLKMTEV